MIESKKLTIFLWLMIITTSFGVISNSHKSRKLFIELQELLEKSQAYEVEWGQLLIEQSTLASYAGLENLAKDELKMGFPARNQIVIVKVENQ